jgi:hypothetical protein
MKRLVAIFGVTVAAFGTRALAEQQTPTNAASTAVVSNIQTNLIKLKVIKLNGEETAGEKPAWFSGLK